MKKKYLVVGLGNTGESVIRFLEKQDIKYITYDTRENKPGLHDPKQIDWSEIEKLVVSPGVPLNDKVILEAKRHKLPVIGDIELFYHEAKAPIIAITGTNAKSTVTTLVADMINATGQIAKMGGNIGIPALDLLEEAVPDFYVLELSSFQLDLLKQFQASVAVVLNISADHLDRHGDMKRYQQVKERVYQNCLHPVINRSLTLLDQSILQNKKCISFGMDAPKNHHAFGLSEQHGIVYLARGDELLIQASDLSSGLSGQHNLENALSALALLSPLDLPLAPQLDVLRTFKGLPHRCVLVKEVNGVKWYNDSKGTNVGATLAAIQGIGVKASQKLILLLGGVAKDQDFSDLRSAIQTYVREVIIYGQDRHQIAKDLQGLPCTVLENMSFAEILMEAKQRAEVGESVLFSPACASYDMFKNFEDRGEQFTKIVKGFSKIE